jgi:antitoxin component of MazEF toxin-antitoxin module
MLRAIFGAPGYVLTTSEAKIGDDTASIVRLPPDVFQLLGVVPSDQVQIEFANRYASGVALEVDREQRPKS